MIRSTLIALSLLAPMLTAAPAPANPIGARPGWVVIDTDIAYADLVARTVQATKANGLVVVTQAGPTKAAAARGITIPGNRVIGVFNNDFAVRMLDKSTAAMIEAPVRLYVTEDADGGATLSYKTPSFVFAPYSAPGVAEIAQELDKLFARIAQDATKQSQ